MKLIVIEGGDRLGKSTLIEGICKKFDYNNITIRHFGKPPKGMTVEETLDYQFKCFDNEIQLVHKIKNVFCYSRYNYYEDIIIWNRSHLGEYVYGQMFRNVDGNFLKNKLMNWEITELPYVDNKFDIYLITLTADPYFFLLKEDGDSFSQNLEQKTKELELFKEAHDFSKIKNKLMLKVDEVVVMEETAFRSKKQILKEVIQFVK